MPPMILVIGLKKLVIEFNSERALIVAGNFKNMAVLMRK